jgi:hypothetical protein
MNIICPCCMHEVGTYEYGSIKIHGPGPNGQVVCPASYYRPQQWAFENENDLRTAIRETELKKA